MVAALGGPHDLLERSGHYLPQAPVQQAVLARDGGHVVALDVRALGQAVVALGGGRTQPVSAVAGTASRQGIAARVANVFSTDCFYGGDPALVARLLQYRIAGVEMESAGLYGLAMREGIQALSVLTVSDHLQRDEHMPAEQREQGQARMVALVLDSLASMPAG